MKIIKKVFFAVAITVILLVVPRLAGLFADLFNYSTFDPDGAFAWISVHHIFQAAIFFVIMIVLEKTKKLDFGFHLGNKKIGIEITLKFIKFFTIYTIGAYVLIIIQNAFQPFIYPLTSRNIFGYLSFQLLLSGPSEELIFRAFAITVFSLFLKGKFLIKHLSLANLAAAIVFAMAHMRFTFFPFTVSFNSMQILLSLALGIFYGICYEKSKSMYYPMIMHSFSNVLMVGITIILSFII